MTNACIDFRRALAGALSPADEPQVRRAIGWHEHLLSCEPCRRLLEAEEALDELLVSLPEPDLPEDLARRVLARLEGPRADLRTEGSLDALLEHAPAPDVPTGLAGRVLGELVEARREEALDRVLERVPAPEIPGGLAERVLAGLASERRVALGRGRLLGFPRARLLAAVAALLLVVLFAWRWRRERADVDEGSAPNANEPRIAERVETGPVQTAALEVPDELLAELELLENWELLLSDDLDVLLDELDPVELELIELEVEEEG